MKFTSIVAAVMAVADAKQRVTAEDIYYQRINEFQPEKPDMYRDYFYNPQHQKMDYDGYFKAIQQGIEVPKNHLPGADFNMQVTDWLPQNKLFNQSQYETTVDTIGKALVSLEAIKDILMRIQLATEATEQNIMYNNEGIRMQQYEIHDQLKYISDSMVPKTAQAIDRTLAL